MEKQNANWNYKISNMRGIGIIAVVLGHSIIAFSNSWKVYGSHQVFYLDLIKSCIDTFQMPLFFLVSGYLFLLPKRKVSFKQFIIKKMYRLIIPFFCVGLCWMIPLKIMFNYPYYEGLSYLDAMIMFFKGEDVGHLETVRSFL